MKIFFKKISLYSAVIINIFSSVYSVDKDTIIALSKVKFVTPYVFMTTLNYAAAFSVHKLSIAQRAEAKQLSTEIVKEIPQEFLRNFKSGNIPILKHYVYKDSEKNSTLSFFKEKPKKPFGGYSVGFALLENNKGHDNFLYAKGRPTVYLFTPSNMTLENFQVRSILAHELGHHYYKDIYSFPIMRNMCLATPLLVYAGLKKLSKDSSGSHPYVEETISFFEKYPYIVFCAQLLVFKKFSRFTEKRADIFSYKMDPRHASCAKDFFKTFGLSNRFVSFLESPLSTHPSIGSRIKLAQKYIK